MTNVVIMSMWRNDADRDLQARAEHLLEKRNPYGHLRWVWIMSDSSDNTDAKLTAIARQYSALDVEIVRKDTKIVGEDTATRVIRLSLTANIGFDAVLPFDDVWMIHESDLISPSDLVQRFLDSSKDIIAGWPVLGPFFYDTWAYRAHGARFQNEPPYHAVYRPNELFEVDSVGSVWAFPAQELREGLRCFDFCAVELCRKLKERGYSLWVDPTIVIQQPQHLWTPGEGAPG